MGLTCTFDASGSATNSPGPLEFSWRFGDGQTAFNVVAPSHTFAQAGTYSVTLQVVDYSTIPNRVGIITKQVTVGTTERRGPVAAFTYSCTGQQSPAQPVLVRRQRLDIRLVDRVVPLGVGQRPQRDENHSNGSQHLGGAGHIPRHPAGDRRSRSQLGGPSAGGGAVNGSELVSW